MPRVQHVDKKETPSPADDDWKFYFCQDFTSCPGVRRSWRVGVQWCAGLYTVQCMKTLWAHIYGHHVHMAVNHTCGPLNPYVHFSRHVRHFQSQIWSMLRLPQWWRLRRLQLRLIRGGPVDDKILKQNRKRQRSKICGKKKWSCFKSCLDVSKLHAHRSYMYILIPSKKPPRRGLSARGVGHVHGRCPEKHMTGFFSAGFPCKKTIHVCCNLDSKSDLSPKNGSFGVKPITFLGGVTKIAPMVCHFLICPGLSQMLSPRGRQRSWEVGLFRIRSTKSNIDNCSCLCFFVEFHCDLAGQPKQGEWSMIYLWFQFDWCLLDMGRCTNEIIIF